MPTARLEQSGSIMSALVNINWYLRNGILSILRIRKEDRVHSRRHIQVSRDLVTIISQSDGVLPCALGLIILTSGERGESDDGEGNESGFSEHCTARKVCGVWVMR